MNDDRDLSPIVGAWLREVPELGERARIVRSVRAQVHGTAQRHHRPIAMRSRTMFSATRLIAAIAIVALGTGTLFFAASPGPSPTPVAVPSMSPIPGPSLVTEMVAPGVVRVLGVRETSSPTAPWVFRLDEPGDTAMNHTGIGPDGTVWILETERLLRLDDPAQWPREGNDRPDLPADFPDLGDDQAGPQADVSSDYPGFNDDIQVAADGTVFMPAGPGVQIRSFDGAAWATERTGSLFDGQPADGAIWASHWQPTDPSQLDGELRIARWADGRWTEWPVGLYDVRTAAATPDGVAWLGFHPGSAGNQRLQRFDGTAVTDVVIPGTPSGGPTHIMASLDGTLWVYLRGRSTEEAAGTSYARYLARLTADGWSVFDEEDGVPLMRDFFGGAPGHMAVGPDGRVWLTPQQDPRPHDHEWWVDDCHGVASFDGAEWTTYLQGICVMDLDVSPDGDVWVQTLVPNDDPRMSTAWVAGPTYRITPAR